MLARADVAIGQVGPAAGQQDATQSETITVKARKRLLKANNAPSAVTELGARQIRAAGIGGSPATLLRQAPSVYVYQQGLGDNAAELSVRGVRGLEIATTLDGVPIQDLLAPSAFYLANNIGGNVTLNQIAGVSIYPGVAYPDNNTFGTIGGTIAYRTRRPYNDFYLDVTGTIGSFGTYREGFGINSGALDSALGTGDNALKLLLTYQNVQNQGFIDFTGSRENEMEFALDKPYSDGLSKFQATAIYNQASGLIENEPVPIPYLRKYGQFSNYPDNLDFAQQHNDYLTIILKDDNYVNDDVQAGATSFYLANNNRLETYGDIGLLVPGGATPVGALSRYFVDGAGPFINNEAGYGAGGLFGPPTPPPYGYYGGGYGGVLYGTGHTYNPYALYPAGSRYCPNTLLSQYGGVVFAPCGLNDEILNGHSDTYGIQPRFVVTPPDFAFIANTIKVGALVAKETSPNLPTYLGGAPQSDGVANQAVTPSGGTSRTIFLAYIQDKIDFLDNTLHLTPGLTGEGTSSSFASGDAFGSLLSPAYGPNGAFSLRGCACRIDQYGPYKEHKWDREVLPFANISYDFDKINPMLAGISAYGSFGNSALFAPVSDFGPDTSGPPPYASIVHLYEAGLKYGSPTVLLSADYFYQKIDRDYGYFSFQSGPLTGVSDYSSFGQRETKGIEASATWQVTPELQLFGNASHLLAKYLTTGFSFDTVAEDQYGISFKGTPETGAPDWLSTFGVDYARKSTLADNDSLDVRLTGQFTGHQYTSYDLTPDDYLHIPNFPGLAPLDYSGCTGQAGNPGCAAYARYQQVGDATTYDPHGGIDPFVIFSLDANYKLPTPQLPALKSVTFDLNIQNLFDKFYYQYFYRQISPAQCGFFPLAAARSAVSREAATRAPGNSLMAFLASRSVCSLQSAPGSETAVSPGLRFARHLDERG